MEHLVIDSKEVVVFENEKGKIYTEKRADGNYWLVAEHKASGLFSCLEIGASNSAVNHLELVADVAYYAGKGAQDYEMAFFWEPLYIGKQKKKSVFLFDVETISWEETALAGYAEYGDFTLFVLYEKDTAFFVPLVYNINRVDLSDDYCLFYLLLCNIVSKKPVNIDNDSASAPLCVSDVVGDFLSEKQELTRALKEHGIICGCADYLDD